MATSMSGQWLKVDVYREYLDPQTGKATQFCMLGKDGAEEACFLEPYPMPGTLQQKRAIARAIGTTYIYDFLGLIEKAMVLEWRQFIAGTGTTLDVPVDMFRAEVGCTSVGMQLTHSACKAPGLVTQTLEPIK